MAFWRKKQAEFDEMDQIIQENPGIRPAELVRQLGVARSTILRPRRWRWCFAFPRVAGEPLAPL
jgi:hypothetical protein